MVKLVKSPAKTLSEEDTGSLLEMVRTAKRADRGHFEQMHQFSQFVRGVQWPKQMATRLKMADSRLVINLAYAYVRSMLPTIFFQDPTVKAMAPTPIHEGNEHVWEGIYDNTLPRIGFKDEIFDQLLDTVIFGEGWLKLAIHQGDDEQGEGGRSLTETYGAQVPWGDISVPVAVRVPSYSMIVDPIAQGRRLKNGARFVAIEYLRPYSEMVLDERYKEGMRSFNLEKLEYREGVTTALEDERVGVADFTEFPSPDGPVDRHGLVRFYEVWCYQLVDFKLYKQMVVVAEGASKPLRQPETWKDLVGQDRDWPFSQLVFNRTPDGLPMSDISLIQDLQQALNRAISRVLNHVDRQKTMRVWHRDRVHNLQRAQKLARSDATIVDVEATADGPVELVPPAPLAADVYNFIEQMVRFGERMSGLSEARQGASRNIRTATEAQSIEAGMQIVTNFRGVLVRDMLVSFLTKWTRSLISILPGDMEFVIRQVGDTGSIKWLQFGKKDIDWMPMLNIDVRSFREQRTSEDLQRWQLVAQSAIQMAPALGNGIRFDRIFAEILRASQVQNPGAITGSLLDQQLLQMAEIVRMVMGEPVQVEASDNHAQHMQVIQYFKNSDLWAMILANQPQAAQLINQHEQEHANGQAGFLDQVQELQTNGPTNPFDELLKGDLGNEGRQDRAFERKLTEPGFGS